MSNDRFKQARRSLMNQQGQPRRPITPDFDDDAEEATALVDINELRASAEMQQAAPSRPTPQHMPQHMPRRPSGPQPYAPRPGSPGAPPHAPQPAVHNPYAHGRLDEAFDEDPHEATQMVDINAFNAPPVQPPVRPMHPPIAQPYRPTAPQGGGMRIGVPDAAPLTPHYSQESFAQEADTQYTNMNDFGQEPAYPAAPGRHEGTQTLNLDDIQEVDDFAPSPVTYTAQESTQFVDLKQVTSGPQAAAAPAGAGMPPQQDQNLAENYLFTPDAIQQYGNFTLIFAKNRQGQDVVLKRVWPSHSSQMPEDLRQKLTAMGQMNHPHLARLNGVFDSHSGCWAELERPPGQRLTYLLQNGPQTRHDVSFWAYPIADAMQYIHSFSMIYGNLTPDAVWIDDQTKSILLEPFDILAFEDRGTLGAYGPPELQQPAAHYTPSTDLFSFAAVIVAALTATPDPNQVGLIEFQKLRNELVRALELNSTLRPQEFAPILDAIGPRIDLNQDAKKGFDKRLLIPIVLIVVLLVGILFFMGGDSKPKVTYRQENITLPAEDRVAVATEPGEVDEDPQVIVLHSYRYNPPEKVDPLPVADVDIRGHLDDIKKRLAGSSKFAQAEAENEYKEIMKLLKDIETVQQGKLTDEQKEVYTNVMLDKGFRAYRLSLINNLEKRLFSESNISDTQLSYQAFSIDPHANEIDFFLSNKRAKIVPVKASSPPAEKEPDTKPKEENTP